MRQLLNKVCRAIVLCLALLVIEGAGTSTGGEVIAAEPERFVTYFGSAGSVPAGFDEANNFSRFNEDCRSPTSNANDRQIVHTTTSTSAIMELAWGDWSSSKGRQNIADCMVKRLVEAKAFGKKTAIVSVDFILWDATQSTAFRYRGDEFAVPELETFFKQLERNNVVDLVKNGYCYVVDEPALYGIGERDMEVAVRAIQRAAATVPSLGRCKTYVIYSYGNYPGIQHIDLVGQDHYDIGVGILSIEEFERFRAMLRPMTDPNPQWISVVPGGAFGQDPAPFFEKMRKDPQVKGLTAFIFFDGWEKGKFGIHGNGMSKFYCAEGKKFLNPDVDNPDCTTAPPTPDLTVNDAKHVIVSVGDELCYRWNATGDEENPKGTKHSFTSYWWSTHPSCSYGYNGGRWVADSAGGSFCWPADSAQAGCTYTITYATCGSGGKCSADAISVAIRGRKR